jgi:DNA modification methylase
VSAGAQVQATPHGTKPADYHCNCEYCSQSLGELRPNATEYYSRLERREYYAKDETRKEDGSGHIAKTPLHIARWAIQQYTVEGDWVLDPTIGAGTTAVEALTQGRHVAGMELEYGIVLKANIEKALEMPGARDCKVEIAQGDARNIGEFLKGLDTRKVKRRFDLIVNNPPYSGDVSAYPKRDKTGAVVENMQYLYNPTLPNLAFLKEGDEYWEMLEKIYDACIDRLKTGGYFVVGVKDMVRQGQPYLLHKKIAEVILGNDEMKFVGTAFLRHHPGTWFLNSNKTAPQYQTITVFQKVPQP